MGRKKERPPPLGAPDWMVTYGDMMTLLLCFFVLLFAFRVVGEQAKVSNLIGQIRRGFESQRSLEPKDGKTIESRDAVKTLEKKMKDEGAQQLNIRGVVIQVMFVDEGLKFVFPGRRLFESGESELAEDLREVIAALGQDHLAGYKNKIEVRGFTSNRDEDSRDGSHWKLGYERARSVARLLSDATQGGVQAARLRLWSGGDNELISTAVADRLGNEKNRRVEIILYEMYYDDGSG